MTYRLAGAAMLAASAVLLGACANRVVAPPAQSVAHVEPMSAGVLPAHLADLTVQNESLPGQIRSATGSYATSIGFYSLRKTKLVEATLEVIKLSSSANWRSAGFRTSLVNQLSGSVPNQIDLDGHSVYQSAGSGSTEDVWFNGRYVLLLTIRSNYPTPRSLAESALALDLQ